MEKKSKIQQIYGYAICLVSVITFLISLTALINSIIDANDPLYSWGHDQNLSSYENFKLNALNSAQSENAYIPDELTLKTMYEDAKNHKIRNVKHHTSKSIIVNTILLVLCVILFTTHWVWMRRLNKIDS